MWNYAIKWHSNWYYDLPPMFDIRTRPIKLWSPCRPTAVTSSIFIGTNLIPGEKLVGETYVFNSSSALLRKWLAARVMSQEEPLDISSCKYAVKLSNATMPKSSLSLRLAISFWLAVLKVSISSSKLSTCLSTVPSVSPLSVSPMSLRPGRLSPS